MPSGSHGGGGGGSHFSGGGSHFGGGYHSSGGSFSSYTRAPRPIRSRRIIFFGRPYIFTTGGTTYNPFALFGILIALAILFVFSGVVVVTSSNSKVHLIEQDYEYYQDMISYAKEHPEFKKEAIITDRFQNDDNDKYYLTYKIACATCSGGYLEGYTYSVYTREEIRNYQVGTVVDAATNSATVTSTTDSITMDYADKTLNDDGEYLSVKASKGVGIGMVVISSIVFVASVIGIVYKFKKSLKLDEENRIKQEEEKIKESYRNTCPYCGQLLNEGTVKCPNCGAGLKHK